MAEFSLTPHRRTVLRAIRDAGGALYDESGLVTTRLMAVTGHRTSNALAAILLELERAGLVKRDMGGRRTYSIELTRAGKKLAAKLDSFDDPKPAPEEPEPATREREQLAGALRKALHTVVSPVEARVSELEHEVAELRDLIRILERKHVALLNQVNKGAGTTETPAELKSLEKLMRQLLAKQG